MVESKFFKPVSIGFAVVTLVESIIWTSLAFLAILCYNDIIDYNSNTNYGLNAFTLNLYIFYLSEKTFSNDERTVTPETFYIFMWIYFFLSLFLFFSSAIHIAILVQKSYTRKVNFSTLIWLVLLYTICVYDIIICIMFGLDYHLVKARIKKDSAETEVMLAVVITMIILSAKGFVLWIANLTFSIIVTVLFRQKVSDEPIIREGPEALAENSAAYQAYGNIATNNNDKDQRSIEQKSTNTASWFSRLAREDSRRSIISASSIQSAFSADPPDGIFTATSTWSHIPRTSSFRQPRSLAVSLSSSPVSSPIKDNFYKSWSESWRGNEGNSSGYRTDDEGWRRQDEEYEEEDEEDNVSESVMSMALPYTNRFTLNEPDPDYI